MIAKCFSPKNPRASSVLRLVNYITHDQGKASRVGEVSVANCHNDDPYMAAMEMQNRQDMNTRAKGDKTFHLMLSFRPGETPTPEAMRQIEEAVCAGLGYGEHQRVSVVHSDTDSTHIHLAINKIHPGKNTMHCPRYPYKLLASLCRELEQTHSLRQDNHAARKSVGEGKAQDMERMSGAESLVSWVRRECLMEVAEAKTWAECHEIFARNGLELKPQGAGLVIATQDGLTIKASTVDRALSKGRLEKRFGAVFEFCGGQERTAEKVYKKEPVAKETVAGIYREYQDSVVSIKKERDATIAKIKERRDVELNLARLEYKTRQAKARAAIGRGLRATEFAGASKVYKATAAAIRQAAKDRLREAYQSAPRRTWLAWLQEQAKSNRPEAVRALRARAYSAAIKITNSIQGEQSGAGGPIHPGQKIDGVTKNGNVIYRVGDDAVKDTGQQLALSREASQDTIVMALRIAQQRFNGPLFVSGSPEYRERIVKAAVDANLKVRFENSDMEEKRRRLTVTRKGTLTNSRTKKRKEME